MRPPSPRLRLFRRSGSRRLELVARNVHFKADDVITYFCTYLKRHNWHYWDEAPSGRVEYLVHLLLMDWPHLAPGDCTMSSESPLLVCWSQRIFSSENTIFAIGGSIFTRWFRPPAPRASSASVQAAWKINFRGWFGQILFSEEHLWIFIPSFGVGERRPW